MFVKNSITQNNKSLRFVWVDVNTVIELGLTDLNSQTETHLKQTGCGMNMIQPRSASVAEELGIFGLNQLP